MHGYTHARMHAHARPLTPLAMLAHTSRLQSPWLLGISAARYNLPLVITGLGKPADWRWFDGGTPKLPAAKRAVQLIGALSNPNPNPNPHTIGVLSTTNITSSSSSAAASAASAAAASASVIAANTSSLAATRTPPSRNQPRDAMPLSSSPPIALLDAFDTFVANAPTAELRLKASRMSEHEVWLGGECSHFPTCNIGEMRRTCMHVHPSMHHACNVGEMRCTSPLGPSAHLSPLTPHSPPLTSHLSPLTSHFSPLSLLAPLTSHLPSLASSRLSPLA